ncbi:hypothetical protein FNH22_15800 [Fulvivirga sp. M361]|uniref:hypothetical protein n=1 Tax=Fulvivirga sp. M361 TaxID=2594266 RepID=UPI001179F291|nr:hypothetical protein [Fulvivirga sp. M361]TRX57601.1 hypothetical protein FNH22_15800 [Fulvivirga sp. M361]
MELNARSQKVEAEDNCTVEIEKQATGMTFNLLSGALPLPTKPDLRKKTDLIPFQQELNQEQLTIKKLAKGSYKLFIDDREVGSFTHRALKAGINLSAYSTTPQYQQAEHISELCFEYKKVQNEIRTIYFIEYRMLQNYDGPNTIAGKRAYLDWQLEKQKGKSYYNWNVKNCNRYFEVLPNEQKLWKELEVIREKIYTSNTPQWHTFKLKKIS